MKDTSIVASDGRNGSAAGLEVTGVDALARDDARVVAQATSRAGRARRRERSRARAPASSSTWVNPPVEAPTSIGVAARRPRSRTARSAGPSLLRAAARRSGGRRRPPRERRRRSASRACRGDAPRSSRVPRGSSACAFWRVGAWPRSTRSTSTRMRRAAGPSVNAPGRPRSARARRGRSGSLTVAGIEAERRARRAAPPRRATPSRPSRRRVGRLARISRPSRSLPERLGGRRSVEDVVGDLERESHRLAVASHRRAVGPRGARMEGARARRWRRSARPSCAGGSTRAGAAREACARPRRSASWPPTMPAWPARRATSGDRLRAPAAARVPGGTRRQDLERAASAARRPRGSPPLRRRPCGPSGARGAGRRRPSPADRRGSASTCGSARGRPRARARRPTRPPNASHAAKASDGAEALAAGEHGVAHRLERGARRALGSREDRLQRGVDVGARGDRGTRRDSSRPPRSLSEARSSRSPWRARTRDRRRRAPRRAATSPSAVS